MVRLMTLADLEGNWPIKVVGNVLHYADVTFEAIGAKVRAPSVSKEGLIGGIRGSEAVFKRSDADKLLSLMDLSAEVYAAIPNKHLLPDGETLETHDYVPPPGHSFDFVRGSRIIPVTSVELRLKITKKMHLLPVKAANYVQTEFKGALAYAYIAKGEVNGKEVGIELIFLPHSDGLLKLRTIQFLGPAQMREFTLVHIPGQPPNYAGS
jgi:hypothetical protein